MFFLLYYLKCENILDFRYSQIVENLNFNGNLKELKGIRETANVFN